MDRLTIARECLSRGMNAEEAWRHAKMEYNRAWAGELHHVLGTPSFDLFLRFWAEEGTCPAGAE